jgi:hypothetical protein
MCSMRILYWLLPLSRKCGKDRATVGSRILTLKSIVDGILSKAPDRVMLQVRS